MNTIQHTGSPRPFGIPSLARRSGQGAGSGFLDLAVRAAQSPPAAEAAPVEPAGDFDGTEVYLKRLRAKYGRVTVQDVGRDQESLAKAARGMSGQDVVIAPNILEEMAQDPRTAIYYEQKIDYFFQTIVPRETARCAAMGLVFEPCGVVVHADGSVTYICGCSDSPERVAEVNRINRAKQEKKAAQQRLYQQQAAQATMERQAAYVRALQHGERMLAAGEQPQALLSERTPAVPLPAGTELFLYPL